MKRYILLTFILLAFIGVSAQSISVKSFQSLPMDMTASSLEGKRVDQNGDVAALIKVVTTQTGFTFEGGALGIVDTKQRNGEIWVWVPRASRKITILHQQLGVLRDYRYPIEIESERTYEMVLTTGTVETIIKEEVRQQYLAFSISPSNATLFVNNELWEVGSDGSAVRFVNFGTYNYRVMAPNYLPETGSVTVDDPNNTKTVDVKLKSDFVEVTLKVDADAEIWVNNEKKGIRTWTGQLGKGSYKIECKKEGHETSMISKEITAEMNGKTIALPAPTPVYGSLNVESTPIGATIYIDWKEAGETPKYVKEILVGEHEVKFTKDGYEDYTETITITKGERKQINATLNKQEVVQQSIASTTSSSEDQTFTVNGVSFTMKYVESSSLTYHFEEEQSSFTYYLEGGTFLIGETEVTQSLWKAVMGNNPSYFEGDSLPVERVSWNDCQKFIKRLKHLTGREFRLPTEKEWKYAALGGHKSNGYNGNKYSGGNYIDDVAWYAGNSDGQTHPVGTKLPNELGLYDMNGNVNECIQDKFKSYRQLRGGCWNDDSDRVSLDRSSYVGESSENSYFNGFRLCLSE